MPKQRKRNYSNEPSEFYPLGGSIEPYDIEEEKHL